MTADRYLKVEQPAATQVSGSGWVCLRCGYNLAGIARDGRCPECGLSVDASRPGGEFRTRPEAFLRRLKRGTILVQLSVLAPVILFVLWVIANVVAGWMLEDVDDSSGWHAVTDVASEVAAGVVLLGVATLALVGWWLVTTRDTEASRPEAGEGSRKATRAGAIALAVGAVFLAALSFVFDLSAVSIGAEAAPEEQPLWQFLTELSLLILFGAGSLTTMIGGALYIHSLGVKMGSRKLMKMATFRAWFCPAVGIGGIIACYVGPLVAVILYYRLLLKTHELLGRVIEMRRVSAAG